MFIYRVKEKTLLIVTNVDVLRDLVPFVQFQKREKHSWRNFTLSKATG